MLKHAFVVFCFFLLISCKDDKSLDPKIVNIPLNIDVLRFDRDFAQTKPADFLQLKTKYPYMFSGNDSLWIAKLNDTLQQEINQEVEKAFPAFDKEKEEIALFLKHLKFYFPSEKVPKVLTTTSDVAYEYRVILSDSLLVVGLDNYLGADHKFYQRIPKYVSQGLDQKFLVSDIAGAYANKLVPRPKKRTFLARMVFYGKELYLKDKTAPFLSDAQKIGYSEEQLQWAKENEEQIWRYLIERELLFSTAADLAPRFLDPAPFTKFRLEIDNESPGRIGRYMGWQIVRAFAEKNSLDIKQVLNTPAEEIFQKANYKPQK